MPAILELVAEGGVLVALLALLVALALVTLLQLIVRVMTAPLSHIPAVGGDIRDWLRDGAGAASDALIRWIHADIKLGVYLFHGIGYMFRFAFQTILDAFDSTVHAIEHVLDHAIPVAIGALHHELTLVINGVRALAHSALAEALGALHYAVHSFNYFTGHIPVWIAAAINDFYRHIVAPIAAEVVTVTHTVTTNVLPRLRGAEAVIESFGKHFAQAVATAEELLPQLPTLSYDEIEKLLNKVPWSKIAGLLTFGFLARWAIRALARESGLDRAECRGKVKGICGTNPAAWEQLLLGLSSGYVLGNFEQLANEALAVVRQLESELVSYGGS